MNDHLTDTWKAYFDESAGQWKVKIPVGNDLVHQTQKPVCALAMTLPDAERVAKAIAAAPSMFALIEDVARAGEARGAALKDLAARAGAIVATIDG